MEIKRAVAPASFRVSKFQSFAGTLILVLPHENKLSQFKREVKNKDGSVSQVDQYQTFATVIPLEDGSHRTDEGKLTEWKAGDVHKAYFDGAIRRYLTDLDVPVVGRLGKGKAGKLGGKPWVLLSPTDDDMALVEGMDDLEDKVLKARNEFEDRKAQRTEATATADEDSTEESGATPPPWKK